MNDLWLIGVLGGGAGAALGFPIAVRHVRESKDNWDLEAMLGLWLILTGTGMFLIGLQHGDVVSDRATLVAEHVANTLNLIVWPLFVIITQRVGSTPLRWFDSPYVTFAPVAAYLIVIAGDPGNEVRFLWILPVGIYCSIRIAHVWLLNRHDPGVTPEVRVMLRGFAAVAVALAGAQTFRTFFPWVRPLREIVPFVVAISMLWIASRMRSSLVLPAEADVHDGQVPVPSTSRYAHSNLTSDRASDILNRLEARAASGLYQDAAASLQTIAAAIGTAPHVLSQALNQHAGQSLNEYMTSKRIDHARRELLSPANDCFTIEAIASRAGFASRAAFYRAFRDAEGMTPTKFRAMKRAEPPSDAAPST